MSRTVLVAAGGTGGHLFPAAAFAGEMRTRGWRVVLMTDERGRRYAEGFPADAIEDVPAATIQGVNPFKAANAAMKIVRGIAAARRSLKAMDPAIVAGFGEEHVDEYRLAFTRRGSDEVVHGIVWPLFGREDDDAQPTPWQEVESVLTECKLGEITRLSGCKG